MAKSALDPDLMALLQRHRIPEEAFKSTGLEWEDLKKIGENHLQSIDHLQNAADFVMAQMRTLPEVHSMKSRVKAADHLVAKVIRKAIEKPKQKLITSENYEIKITDLVGVRALHLFVQDWQAIHEFVKARWDLHEAPIAYVRDGDTRPLHYKAAGLKVKTHKAGYRSVHYLLRSNPDKREVICELQVRTLFEEGWSEIDHRVRYPNHSDDSFVSEILMILNRLAGSADEMGSFIVQLAEHSTAHKAAIVTRDEELRKKEKEIEKLLLKYHMSEKQRTELQTRISEMIAPSKIESDKAPVTLGLLGGPINTNALTFGLDTSKLHFKSPTSFDDLAKKIQLTRESTNALANLFVCPKCGKQKNNRLGLLFDSGADLYCKCPAPEGTGRAK